MVNTDLFELIDRKTGKPITAEETEKIAKDGGLMTMDIDQFYIGEDGQIVLVDDCGKATWIDRERFTPHLLGKYPDFEYFEELLMGNIMHSHPELRSAVAYSTHSPQIDVFSQTWPNTAGGFSEPGMMVGQAMTTELTTVISIKFFTMDNKNVEFYGVFFGNKPAYLVDDPSEVFFEDLKNRCMKSKYEAEKAY